MKLLAYKQKQQADNTISKIQNPESGEIEHRLEKSSKALASPDLPSISEEQIKHFASPLLFVLFTERLSQWI